MTKMTEKMAKMVTTMRAAIDFPSEERLDIALRAVLETHVKPLLATAFEHGAVFGRSKQQGIMAAAQEESERIIASLTAPTP